MMTPADLRAYIDPEYPKNLSHKGIHGYWLVCIVEDFQAKNNR